MSLLAFSITQPHSGHDVGITIGFSSPVRLSVIDAITYGITSQLLCNHTQSHMRISFSAIKSKLCNDALAIVTQLSSTGSKFAAGVITPVRPT